MLTFFIEQQQQQRHTWFVCHLSYLSSSVGLSVLVATLSMTPWHSVNQNGVSHDDPGFVCSTRTRSLQERHRLQQQDRQTAGQRDLWISDSCGPDPAVCCQFDFARLRDAPHSTNGAHCPWHKQPVKIHARNVESRAMLLLDQYQKKSALYKSNVVIAPLGDDFRYETVIEADLQFENYQRIFDYLNENVDGVEIQFGTLSEYFEAVLGTFEAPLLKGSFFTYADRNEDYWSGYFTSRIFDKALDRQLERVLYAATSLGANKRVDRLSKGFSEGTQGSAASWPGRRIRFFLFARRTTGSSHCNIRWTCLPSFDHCSRKYRITPAQADLSGSIGSWNYGHWTCSVYLSWLCCNK